MTGPTLKNLPPRFRFTWPEWAGHALAVMSLVVATECLSVVSRIAVQGLEVDPEPYISGIFLGFMAALASVVVQSRWVEHCAKSPRQARLFLLAVSLLLLYAPLDTLARNYRLLDFEPLADLPYIVSLPAPLPFPDNDVTSLLPPPGALCRLWEARGLHPDGLIFDRGFPAPDYYFCENRPVLTDKNYLYLYLGSSNARKLEGSLTIQAFGPDDAKATQQIIDAVADLYAAAHAGTPPAALTKMLTEDKTHATLDTPFGTIDVFSNKGHSRAFRLTACGDRKCPAQIQPASDVLPLPPPPAAAK